MTQEFDPLDYANLTRHVVEELMRQPVVPIGSLARFDGAGVYALFYRGELDFYAGVRSEDSTTPIYVGKAVPPGGRKGQARRSRPVRRPPLRALHAARARARRCRPPPGSQAPRGPAGGPRGASARRLRARASRPGRSYPPWAPR